MGSAVTDDARHEARFDEVHRTVIATMVEVVGEEGDADVDADDAEALELESAEVLEIGARLIEVYEAQVDLIPWLAAMSRDDLVQVTIRDFVEHIVTALERGEALPVTVGRSRW